MEYHRPTFAYFTSSDGAMILANTASISSVEPSNPDNPDEGCEIRMNNGDTLYVKQMFSEVLDKLEQTSKLLWVGSRKASGL